MRGVKTIQLTCLLGTLLFGACSSIERGVVVRKGQGISTTPTTRTQDYWVDVRGKNKDGEAVAERLHLFKQDWNRFSEGDSISPHDFDLIGAGKAFRASVKRLTQTGNEPARKRTRPKLARTRPAAPQMPPSARVGGASPRAVPSTEAEKEERFRSVEARAHADPAVRELKLQIHGAKTNDEQTAAWQAHRRALFQKMRDLDPSLKDRIDRADSAGGAR